MTKTEIRQFINQENFDEEAELTVLRALDKYPREELSTDEVRDLMGVIDHLNQELDNDMVALDEETQLLNDTWDEISQIREDEANQIAAAYQAGIEQMGQMAKEAQGQLQQ